MLKKEIKDFIISTEEYGEAECHVPFSLYSVLMENGKVPDPLVGRNIERAAEGIPVSCTFSARVNVSDAEASFKHIYLRLSGIYAKAEICFNGKSYGTAESPNRVYIFDVTDRVSVGENELTIAAVSPLPEKQLIRNDGSPCTDYEMPPYLPDMGIIGICELLPTNSALIKEVRVAQAHEVGRVTLMVGIDTFGDLEDVRAIATLVSPTGQMYFSGISMGHGIITVKDPELWWPHGLGSADLYKLTVTLYYRGEAVDIYERSIGLRSIAVAKDENGVPAVVVNGIKIFSRGATYVRENAVLPYVTRAGTERLVKAAARANMNTLRVISAGVAPSDYFYELCDKLGILVWQDISVSYIVPPIAGAFASGITAALRDVIARTTAHPSVALLYLSVTEAAGGDVAGSADAVAEFRDIAARILRPVVERYSSGVEFIADPSELEEYDERYVTTVRYGTRAANTPSVPSVLSLSQFVPKDEMNLLSATMERHTSLPGAVNDMFAEIAKHTRMPVGIGEISYASGVAAALTQSSLVKSLRSKESISMSAVCRQLNDGWPAVSGSMVDFYGRQKAAMYHARDFYAPMTVYACPCRNKLTVYICNETRKPYSGKLMYALYTNDNKCLFETSREVYVDKMSAALVAEEDMERLIGDNPESVYAIYELSDANGMNKTGAVPFVPYKHFDFKPSDITAEISGMGRSFEVKLAARTYTPGVHISFKGIDAKFAEDYIDHLGTDPIRLTFETADVTTPSTLTNKMHIHTLADIGKE